MNVTLIRFTPEPDKLCGEAAAICTGYTGDPIKALRGALDMSIPISSNLDQLYDFFQRTAEKANMHKDAASAEELKKIIPMIADLRDAFTQISQMTKEEIEAQEKNRKK